MKNGSTKTGQTVLATLVSGIQRDSYIITSPWIFLSQTFLEHASKDLYSSTVYDFFDNIKYRSSFVVVFPFDPVMPIIFDFEIFFQCQANLFIVFLTDDVLIIS